LNRDSRAPGVFKDTATPSQKVVHREEAARLEKALARLPADYRQAILLRHRDNSSFPEIARQLGISENAARKLWVRAVAKLKNELS
jgi:RNA polymerase sigma factor (sigma-70 family)